MSRTRRPGHDQVTAGSGEASSGTSIGASMTMLKRTSRMTGCTALRVCVRDVRKRGQVDQARQMHRHAEGSQQAGPPIPGSGSRPGGWASRRGAPPAWPCVGIPRSTDGSAGPLAAIAVGLVMAARMASGMSWTGTDVAGLGSRAHHRRPVTRLASRTPADQPEHLSVDVLKYRALEAPPVAT